MTYVSYTRAYKSTFVRNQFSYIEKTPSWGRVETINDSPKMRKKKRKSSVIIIIIDLISSSFHHTLK